MIILYTRNVYLSTHLCVSYTHYLYLKKRASLPALHIRVPRISYSLRALLTIASMQAFQPSANPQSISLSIAGSASFFLGFHLCNQSNSDFHYGLSTFLHFGNRYIPCFSLSLRLILFIHHIF